MTRFQRKIYTLTFVILFAITAPTLIFFAKGYRFDTIKKVFIHSGSVIIKSYPKKVDIYIDGKKAPNKKLNFINNYYIVNGLRPGKHTVECKKNGYTSWQKKIHTHSGLSVEFWNVFLMPIPNKTLRTYQPENISRFYLSPRNKNELVLYKKKDSEKIISLFNTKEQTEKTIYKTNDTYDDLIPNKEENIEWSSNHKKIMIPASKNNSKDYIITSLKNLNEESLSLYDIFEKISPNILQTTTTEKTSVHNKTKKKIINDDKSLTKNIPPSRTKNINESDKSPSPSAKIYQARWIFDSDAKIILLTTNHQLIITDILKPTESILIDNNVNGFDLAGDHIYYTKISDNVIWDIKSNQPERKKAIATINIKDKDNDFLKMIAYDEYRIALITSDKELYIFNQDKEKERIFFNKINNDTNGIQYSDDGKKMLYWTNSEIWVYMLRDWKVQPNRQEGEKIFITRFSSPLKNVQWLQTFENILFTNNNFVKLSELDNRDHINLINIFTSNALTEEYSYIYNKDNSTLYFLDSIKKNSPDLKLQSIVLIENNGFFNLGN